MIPVGNKISVIASSTKSKGARIRKGSQGYISTIGEISSPGLNSFNGGGAMYIVPAKIVFTRFGHERKLRNEVKFVALVFPSIDPEPIKRKKIYLNKLVKRALDYSEDIRQIWQNEGIRINKVTAVAVSGLGCSENLTSNPTEFAAWLRSIAISGSLHKILLCNTTSPYRKTINSLTGGDKKLLVDLHACVSKKARVESFTNSLFKGDRKELTGFILRMQEVLKLEKLRSISAISDNRPTRRGGGTTFGKSWELHTLGLSKLVGALVPRNYGTERIQKHAAGWFDAYTDIK